MTCFQVLMSVVSCDRTIAKRFPTLVSQRMARQGQLHCFHNSDNDELPSGKNDELTENGNFHSCFEDFPDIKKACLLFPTWLELWELRPGT